MNNSEKSIKYKTQLSSGAIKSIIKNIVKTKDSNGIKIRSEHDWLCPVDSEEAERIVEPNLSIVKSEYELQTNFLNWTLDKADDSAEEEEDAEGDNNDDKDWNYGGDTNKPITTEPIVSTDDTIKAILERSELKECRRGKYSLFEKKRNFFESYLLRACPYCGTEFESVTAWDTHLNDMHNYKEIHNTHFSYSGDGKVSCKECKSILNGRLAILKTHLLVHLPHMNIFKCKICVYACSKYSVLLSHIEIKHFDVVGESLSALLETSFKSCAYCGKYVGIFNMLSTHIQTEHGAVYEHKLFYVCPFCGEQFGEEKSHKEHLKNIHQFESLNGLSFEIIEEHENNVNQKKYRCLKCMELFVGSAYSSTLISHALRHLPYKCFKCRYCEYDNFSKSNVIQHTCKALLLDIKNNSMQTAKRSPSRQHIRKLKRRRRRNLDVINKLHVCPKCGENFEQQALWEAHLIQEHRFDKYESLNIETTVSADGKKKVTSCKICKKIFAKPCDFFIKQHAYIHMPYKIYKCKLCQASMNSLYVCHCQDISPLCVCPKCGKEFNKEFNMRKHITKMHDLREPSGLNFNKISHTETPNYKCSDCGEIIQESSPSCTDLLFKHAAREHMPFKLYKCSNCDEQSDSKYSIIDHCNNCRDNHTILNINTKNEVTNKTKTNTKKIKRSKRVLTTEDVENKVDKKETKKHRLKILKRKIQSDSLEIDTNNVKKFAQTNMLETSRCKVLKRSDSNNSLEVHCNIENRTELSIKAENEEVASEMIKTIISTKLILSTEDAVENKVEKKERKIHPPKILKKKTQSDYLKIDTNNVEKFEQTNMAKKPRCKVLKRSDSNIENRTELNATTGNEEVANKPTTKANITTNLKFSTDDGVKKKVDKKETNKPVCKILKKKTQSDTLEVDTNIVEKFAQTSMAISTHKSGYFNKYSKYITYACPECNIPLATSEAWHTHICREHDFFAENRLNITSLPGVSSKGICNECCETVHGCILHKQRHKLTHMPYQAFVCNICIHRTKTINILFGHIEKKHFSLGKFNCIFCDVVFSTFYERFEHIKSQHSDDELENVCKICSKRFKRSKFMEHMQIHNFNRILNDCGYCNRKFCFFRELFGHWKRNHPAEFELYHSTEQEKKTASQQIKPKMKK